MSKEKKAALIGIGVLIVLLVTAWLWVYLRTTEGANFGCMPDPLPKWIPEFIREWLELYCNA